MMTPSEEKQISLLNQELTKEIQIEFIQTDHEKSAAMRQFCDRLAKLAPKIIVKNEEGDPDEVPAIQIHDGLRYRAVPKGTEMAPFIEALMMLDHDTARIDVATKTRLAKVELPTNLIIYVSPQCKFCPQAVRQLLPLLSRNSHIRLTVIDVLHFAELAEMDNIQSVPTLILEDHFRWTGSLQLNEILDVIKNRDPSMLGPVSLEMMLKEGKAGELAAMMLDKAHIFPAFYEVLAHPKWPVRLGAMVVMEELIESNPDLAAEIIEPLWERFQTVDNRVKGDLLYLFGQLNHSECAPRLQAILDGDYDFEVQEAAREALDKIGGA
jgi:hypothetical protein